MNVLVPLADGFEEIEALTIIDILRRAGIEVVTASLQSSMVESARGVRILADAKLDDINPNDFDAIALPGGPGHENLLKSQLVLNLIKEMNSKGKIIAAICASPLVLAKAGILNDKRATIYPGLEKNIPRPRSDAVVIDGNVITSQAPGTAMEFALKIVELLAGKNKMEEVKERIVYRG